MTETSTPEAALAADKAVDADSHDARHAVAPKSASEIKPQAESVKASTTGTAARTEKARTDAAQAKADFEADAIEAERIKITARRATLYRCRVSASIAFQLVTHLASNSEKDDFSAEDYKAIRQIFQVDPDIEDTTEAEVNFWFAYNRIVARLDEKEDPEGIYYTALFEMQDPKARGLYGLALTHYRTLTRFSNSVGTLAVLVMLALVGLLAYGTIVNDLTTSYRAFLTEQIAIEGNRLENTRLGNVSGADCTRTNTPGVIQSQLNIDCANALEQIGLQLASTTAALSALTPIVSSDGSEESASMIFVFQTQVLTFLETYVYPLLAGALGACVSILRMIFSQLATKTLHIRIIKAAYLRIAVGMIAGIVIGWVVPAAGDTGISLAPLAMAFVAGYSVEIIYTLLDRIVAAFSAPAPGTPRGASPLGRDVAVPGSGAPRV